VAVVASVNRAFWEQEEHCQQASRAKTTFVHCEHWGAVASDWLTILVKPTTHYPSRRHDGRQDEYSVAGLILLLWCCSVNDSGLFDCRQMDSRRSWFVRGVCVHLSACEKGNIWLNSNECYRYTGASAYCPSNDILDDNEVFLRLQLKYNDSVRIRYTHALSLLLLASLCRWQTSSLTSFSVFTARQHSW